MVKTLSRGRITGILPKSMGLKFLIGTAQVGNSGSIQLSDPMRDIIFASASVWKGTPARTGSMTYNVRGSATGKYLVVTNIQHGFGTPGIPRGGTSEVHPISFVVFGR